jgi:hypothetical protein
LAAWHLTDYTDILCYPDSKVLVAGLDSTHF